MIFWVYKTLNSVLSIEVNVGEYFYIITSNFIIISEQSLFLVDCVTIWI